VSWFTHDDAGTGYTVGAKFSSCPERGWTTEAEMKALVTALFLAAVFLATAMQVASQPGDQRPEGEFTVAQRFCPNGRC
jgi:hypothetical protein